jgi:hypothetical protein
MTPYSHTSDSRKTMVKKAAAHSALRRYIEPKGRKGMPEHSSSEDRKRKMVSEVPATTGFGVVDMQYRPQKNGQPAFE